MHVGLNNQEVFYVHHVVLQDPKLIQWFTSNMGFVVRRKHMILVLMNEPMRAQHTMEVCVMS